MRAVTEADLRRLPDRSIVTGPAWNDEVYVKAAADEWFGVGSDVPWTARNLEARGPFVVLRQGIGPVGPPDTPGDRPFA